MTFEEIIRGKKAALIDMDGVLYDSMPGHCRAWRETMLEEGLDLKADEFFLYEGMTGADTINLIMRREKGITMTPEQCEAIYAVKSAKFREGTPPVPMPGALNLLTLIRDKGLKTVLVTGSAQNSLLNRLDIDYPGFFPPSMRVTALDVKRGKPNPEPYLKGLEKAAVRPEEAIVIENAPLGVRAAKAAGIFTVAWLTGPIPRSSFEDEGADFIMPRLIN